MHPVAAARLEALDDSIDNVSNDVADEAQQEHLPAIDIVLTAAHDQIEKRLPEGKHKALAVAAITMAMNFAVKALLRGRR